MSGGTRSCRRRTACNLLRRSAKLFHNDPRASFLAHAGKYSDALAKNEVLAPAKDIGEMAQIIFNDKINAGLTILFLSVVVTVAAYGLRTALKARKVGW